MSVLPKWCSRPRNDHPGVTEAMAFIDTPPVELLEATPGTAANNTPAMKGREAPNLLNIHLENRLQITGELISNEPISSANRRSCSELGSTPSIVLVNRQLYSEAFSHTYHHNTAIITIRADKIAFLEILDDSIWGNRRVLNGPLPEAFPFWALKEVVIKIVLTEDDGNGMYHRRRILGRDQDIRENLFTLCGMILEQKLHFQNLRVTFFKSDPRNDGWDELWDSENSDHMKEEFFAGIFGNPRKAFEHPTCPSSFAWVLSVFALCPGIADECVVELPDSLKGKAAMEKEAKKYEMGLNGRSPILEDYCLEDDRWHLTHPDEQWYLEETCERCTREWNESLEKERCWAKLHMAGERLLHAYGLRNSNILPGVEFWESPLYDGLDKEFWAPWSWENARKWIMDAMEKKLGIEHGRKLYHLCLWAIKLFGWNYSDEHIRSLEDLLGDQELQNWRRIYADRVQRMVVQSES